MMIDGRPGEPFSNASPVMDSLEFPRDDAGSANPYASPETESIVRPKISELDLSNPALWCPQCRGKDVMVVPYNPWTGRAGPRAIDHLRCCTCGMEYNGETGHPTSASSAVLRSFVLALALCVPIGLLWILQIILAIAIH